MKRISGVKRIRTKKKKKGERGRKGSGIESRKMIKKKKRLVL